MFYMFIEILLIQEIKLLTEKTEETVRLWYVFLCFQQIERLGLTLYGGRE